MLRRYIVCAMLVFPQLVFSDIGIGIGVNITYHGDVGISAKVLSSNKSFDMAWAIGASYYPLSNKKYGFDIGYGGNALPNGYFLIGLDILQDASYGGVGYINQK